MAGARTNRHAKAEDQALIDDEGGQEGREKAATAPASPLIRRATIPAASQDSKEITPVATPQARVEAGTG